MWPWSRRAHAQAGFVQPGCLACQHLEHVAASAKVLHKSRPCGKRAVPISAATLHELPLPSASASGNSKDMELLYMEVARNGIVGDELRSSCSTLAEEYT